MLYRFIIGLTLLTSCVVNDVLASDLKAQFSGFASLAISYSDDPDIGFSSSYSNESDTGWSVTRDSILGGQANLSWAQNWDSVVQVVWQDHVYKEFNNFVELAFIRYRPSRNWAIRAGRLNSDLYLLSEYPFVGYAYLWARPPHEYYSFASAGGRFEGADVEYSQALFDGFLRLKFAAGETTTTSKSGDDVFFIDFDNLITLSASYVINDWTLRFSASKTDLGSFELEALSNFIDILGAVPNQLWSQAQSFSTGLNTAGHKITYSALGLTYDSDNWLIQSEVSISDSQWLVAPPNLNAYISIGYRFDELTLYSSLSVSENRNELIQAVQPEFAVGTPAEIYVPVQQLVSATQGVIDRVNVHQHSVNFGVKWYFSEKMVIKAQVDHFKIQPFGSGLWDIKDPLDVGMSHNINVFTLSSSVVF